MEFANNLLDALRSRASSGAQGAGNLGFDWPGLHARLVAAHAARAELIRGDSRPVLLDGGFTDWPLSTSSRAIGEHAVNLADLTDGKGPHAIAEAIAGQDTRTDSAGGRGQ
jgi:hypothetical protein